MKYAELQKLKRSVKLQDKRIYTFDAETKDGLKGSKLFCCAIAYEYNRVKTFKSIPTFYRFLVSNNPDERTTVYVHNLSFDVRFLVNYCLLNNLEYNILFANSSCILFEFIGLNYVFIDSFQFLLESQENAELTYNIDEKLRKINCEAIFNKKFKDWTYSEREKVLNHNKNDVLALQQIMRRYREIMFEIANVDILHTITLASFSLKAFRKSLQYNIVNPYLKLKFAENKMEYLFEGEKYLFAKECYYGGRVECFDHNLGINVNYHDIVSMFPFHMKFDDYPYGIPYWEKDMLKIAESLESKLSIIEAIMIPNYKENYPILPFRKDDRTVFANFEEKGIWTSVEIKYAMKRGYKFRFLRALIFPERFNPFEPFVDKFFEIKSNSEGGKQKGAKIILNSCYGKFGQRIERESTQYRFFKTENEAIVFYEEQLDNDRNSIMEYNEFYKQYLVRYSEPYKQTKPFQIVHLSAFITAYARLQIIENIHKLTDSEIRVYYCDTDSIVCEPNNLINLSSELGGWEVEYSFSEFKAISPKCYIARIDTGELLLKCKGIRRDKIKEIIELNGSVDTIYQTIKEDIIMDEQYLPLKSSIVRNKTALSSAVIKKRMSLEDKKRVTNSDLTTTAISDKIAEGSE